jgi:hypothetical protein
MRLTPTSTYTQSINPNTQASFTPPNNKSIANNTLTPAHQRTGYSLITGNSGNRSALGPIVTLFWHLMDTPLSDQVQNLLNQIGNTNTEDFRSILKASIKDHDFTFDRIISIAEFREQYGDMATKSLLPTARDKAKLLAKSDLPINQKKLWEAIATLIDPDNHPLIKVSVEHTNYLTSQPSVVLSLDNPPFNPYHPKLSSFIDKINEPRHIKKKAKYRGLTVSKRVSDVSVSCVLPESMIESRKLKRFSSFLEFIKDYQKFLDSQNSSSAT